MKEDSNLPFFNFPECLRFCPFSKNGLTTRFLRFKSSHPDTFCCSLRRKETQKVHHFRFESPCLYLLGVLCFRKEILKVHHHYCPENEKNGFRNSIFADPKHVFNHKNPEKPRKTPKGRKKTQKVVVDFLGFFDGSPFGARTNNIYDLRRAPGRKTKMERIARHPNGA